MSKIQVHDFNTRSWKASLLKHHKFCLSPAPFFEVVHYSGKGRLWFEDTGRAGRYTSTRGSSRALARCSPEFGETSVATPEPGSQLASYCLEHISHPPDWAAATFYRSTLCNQHTGRTRPESYGFSGQHFLVHLLARSLILYGFSYNT